jgi:hypothetical protein
VLRDNMDLSSALEYGLPIGLEGSKRHRCSRCRHRSCLGTLFDVVDAQSGPCSQTRESAPGALQDGRGRGIWNLCSCRGGEYYEVLVGGGRFDRGCHRSGSR